MQILAIKSKQKWKIFHMESDTIKENKVNMIKGKGTKEKIIGAAYVTKIP